jgi:hypothetical protein
MRVGLTSKGTRIIRDDWSFRFPPVALHRLTSAAPLRFASLHGGDSRDATRGAGGAFLA